MAHARTPTAAKPRHPRHSLPPWLTPRRDWPLAAGLVTAAIFYAADSRFFTLLDRPAWLAVIFLWLFATILSAAIGVVREAEEISERLGEPFGTLVLTLSITGIEVMSISAVMMHGDSNPTLVRETLFSVVMIVLGGMVGFSLLLGAWRHREQHHNLQGANAYLGVIVPLAVLSLVLPDFTTTTAGPTLSAGQQAMIGFMAVGLYTTFLLLQTGRHKSYFSLPDAPREGPHQAHPRTGLPRHIVLLFAYMIPVVFLVEELAHPVDYITETMGAPEAIGGVLMAILVATPEAIGAVKASLANQLQRSVNLSLGSVLSTIGLTVPVMLVVAAMTGTHLELGLQNSDLLLLILTLAVSVITFASGHTNLLQGMVHVFLFLAFLILLFLH